MFDTFGPQMFRKNAMKENFYLYMFYTYSQLSLSRSPKVSVPGHIRFAEWRGKSNNHILQMNMFDS